MSSQKTYMASFIFFILVSSLYGEIWATGQMNNGTVDDRCKTKLKRMEVLPGRGWDSLRNLDMGQVLDVRYDLCRTSEDGQYLIPDDIYITAIKQTDLQLTSELMEHWSNYTSLYARSFEVNAGYNFFGISSVQGSFDDNYIDTKQRQVNQKSMTTRVQLRNTMYKIQASPTANIDPQLKILLDEAALALQQNNSEKAEVIVEFIIRDYGTHYIMQADAGAGLVEENFVSSTFVQQNWAQKHKITISASGHFLKKFVDFGTNYQTGTEDTLADSYKKAQTSSNIRAFGGAMFQPNMTVKQWSQEVPNNLVTIDRSGNPLSFLITLQRFPNFPLHIVAKLREIINDVIDMYYAYNTHKGCTSQNSTNFDFTANADDGSCHSPTYNFSFAGVFVECTNVAIQNGDLCAKLIQKNPLTKAFTCPINYVAVPLTSGSVTSSGSRRDCHEECSGMWFWKHCHMECSNTPLYSQGNYKSSWCAAMPGTKLPPGSGFMFGGLYTSWINNPVTTSQTCPATYIALKAGVELKVCVSQDFELGYRYSIPFGGFFSCNQGNSLVSSKKTLLAESGDPYVHACPSGYSQHMAVIDNDCEIMYCVIANAFSQQGRIKIILPPFRDQSMLFVTVAAMESINNGTDTQDDGNLSGGSIAGIVIGSIITVILVVGSTLVIFKRYRRRSVNSMEDDSVRNPLRNPSDYGTINEEVVNVET